MIPEAILAKGDRVALEYLLETTPLGAFFEGEVVRKAVAEDILLEQFKPFVFTSLFIDSETLQNSWRVMRPDSFQLAKRLAEESLTPYQKLPQAAQRSRELLRMTTYRKIDAWWCGNEIFAPHESLGAEPYFTIVLPGYEARPVKIGAVQSMLFDSDPKRDAIALELIGKIELIDPIERALFPLLPLEDEKAATEWNELLAVLEATKPFREFDRTHKLPTFPKSVVVDPRAIPGGFVARFRPDGELWKNLYALGISPILSQPETDYLKTKERSIAALASQRDTLLNFLCRSIRFNAQVPSPDKQA
jgi:hypothetical protein